MEFPILRPNELNQSSSGPRYNATHIIYSPFNNSLNTNAKNATLTRASLNSFNLYTGRYSSDGEVLPVDHQLMATLLDPRQPQVDQTLSYSSDTSGAGHRPVSSAALMWKPVDRHGLTTMGLNSDELARNEYLLRVRRLGFNYLKPAGVDRTMQAVLEDEAEEEEEEEDGAFEIDEDIGGVQFAQDEGLTEDGEVIPSENEEEEQEEEEEVDLDEAVEEASEFDYDDDDEEGEDQAREEEDPFMVDEEYDESTTTASTVTANSSTRSTSTVLQTSEPRTPHLQQQQQHRRHPRTSEIGELYFSGIYESDTQRRAATTAEHLEPASSYVDELGMHQRALPGALTVEEEENSDSRTIEDENDGESEMEVD